MNNQINIMRTLLIAFILLVGGAASVSAQQDEATKKRNIRDKAYAVIDREYDAFASVRGNEAFYSFVRLFVNEEAPVYNDLLGSNAPEIMPVAWIPDRSFPYLTSMKAGRCCECLRSILCHFIIA